MYLESEKCQKHIDKLAGPQPNGKGRENRVGTGSPSGEAWPEPKAGPGLQEACLGSTGALLPDRGEPEAWDEGGQAPEPLERFALGEALARD